MVCGGDHGIFYLLDIVNTNNTKDRRRSCTNGQDLGKGNEVSHKRVEDARIQEVKRVRSWYLGVYVSDPPCSDGEACARVSIRFKFIT
jgi:hypothetical protein